MGWRDDRVYVVHDWDSLATAPEAALVGAAAATFPSGHEQPVLATLAETERFLLVYQQAAARRSVAKRSKWPGPRASGSPPTTRAWHCATETPNWSWPVSYARP